MNKGMWIYVIPYVLLAAGLVYVLVLLAHHDKPAPAKKPDPRALYVKAAPSAAQLTGYVCQNEVNNETVSGWETICYPS